MSLRLASVSVVGRISAHEPDVRSAAGRVGLVDHAKPAAPVDLGVARSARREEGRSPVRRSHRADPLLSEGAVDQHLHRLVGGRPVPRLGMRGVDSRVVVDLEPARVLSRVKPDQLRAVAVPEQPGASAALRKCRSGAQHEPTVVLGDEPDRHNHRCAIGSRVAEQRMRSRAQASRRSPGPERRRHRASATRRCGSRPPPPGRG